MRYVILVALVVALDVSPVAGRCIMSYCKDSSTATTPAPSTSWPITNTSRQRVGDIYIPPAMGDGSRFGTPPAASSGTSSATGP